MNCDVISGASDTAPAVHWRSRCASPLCFGAGRPGARPGQGCHSRLIDLVKCSWDFGGVVRVWVASGCLMTVFGNPGVGYILKNLFVWLLVWSSYPSGDELGGGCKVRC